MVFISTQKPKEGKYGLFGNINLNFIKNSEAKIIFNEVDDIPF